MTEEIWKAVVGYEGEYEVSNMGRVRSVDRISVTVRGVEKFLRGRMLRPGPRPSGHLTVALTGSKTHNVHTLVLEAFVGPRPTPMHEARHLDGHENNNRLDNLEWSTKTRNRQDRKYHHRRPWTYKLFPDEVAETKLALLDRRRGVKINLARKYHVSNTTIYNIEHGIVHADVGIGVFG